MCEFDKRCTGGEGTADSVLADVLARIERYGWALVGVLGAPHGGSDFAYTVGLTALGYPELAMYGLPAEVSAPWLNAAADRVIRYGPVQHGARLVAAESDPALGLVAVRMTRPGDLALAEEIYPSDPIIAMQLAWRDLSGLLPWQDRYDSGRCPQPLFGPAPGLLSGPILLGERRHPRADRRRRAS